MCRNTLNELLVRTTLEVCEGGRPGSAPLRPRVCRALHTRLKYRTHCSPKSAPKHAQRVAAQTMQSSDACALPVIAETEREADRNNSGYRIVADLWAPRPYARGVCLEYRRAGQGLETSDWNDTRIESGNEYISQRWQASPRKQLEQRQGRFFKWHPIQLVPRCSGATEAEVNGAMAAATNYDGTHLSLRRPWASNLHRHHRDTLTPDIRRMSRAHKYHTNTKHDRTCCGAMDDALSTYALALAREVRMYPPHEARGEN